MHPSWTATGDVNLISKSVNSLTVRLLEFTLQLFGSILAGVLACSVTTDLSISLTNGFCSIEVSMALNVVIYSYIGDMLSGFLILLT